MQNETSLKIGEYLKSVSRTKIVFLREPIHGLNKIDIGISLSKSIFEKRNAENISMIAAADLEKILNANIHVHDSYGKYISIENIGILFEKDLKFDIHNLLENNSKNNILFVLWGGEIENENFYFLTKQHGIKFNFAHLSHIIA
jgi:hypothetical protein